MRYLLALLIICSSILLNADSSYDRGIKLYRSGDYTPAIKAFYVSARRYHNVNSYYMLGKMHEEGLGTGVNLYTSFYWYEKSAKLNHPTAQYHLAQFYEMGKGTHKDLKRAKLWYQRSAQNGDKNAKIKLAHKSPAPQIDSDKKPKKINSTDVLKDAIDSDNEPRDINSNEKDPTSISEEDNESIVDMLMFWR